MGILSTSPRRAASKLAGDLVAFDSSAFDFSFRDDRLCKSSPDSLTLTGSHGTGRRDFSRMPRPASDSVSVDLKLRHSSFLQYQRALMVSLKCGIPRRTHSFLVATVHTKLQCSCLCLEYVHLTLIPRCINIMMRAVPLYNIRCTLLTADSPLKTYVRPVTQRILYKFRESTRNLLDLQPTLWCLVTFRAFEFPLLSSLTVYACKSPLLVENVTKNATFRAALQQRGSWPLVIHTA